MKEHAEPERLTRTGSVRGRIARGIVSSKMQVRHGQRVAFSTVVLPFPIFQRMQRRAYLAGACLESMIGGDRRRLEVVEMSVHFDAAPVRAGQQSACAIS